MRRVLDPGLAMLLLAGCSSSLPTIPDDGAFTAVINPQVEQQASRFGAGPAVPIHGACDTAIQPATPVGPGVIRQIDVGMCRVSHLGSSSFVSDKLINLATGTQTAEALIAAASCCPSAGDTAVRPAIERMVPMSSVA